MAHNHYIYPDMTTPISIPVRASVPAPGYSALSVSPNSAQSIYSRRSDALNSATHIRTPRVLHPIDNEDLRLLLLENISQDAVAAFRQQGFTVDHSTKAMSEDELVEKIGDYHAIGIRSKTKITERVLKAATKVRLYAPSQ